MNKQKLMDIIKSTRDCATENARDLMHDAENEFETAACFDDTFALGELLRAIERVDECWVDEIIDDLMDK